MYFPVLEVLKASEGFDDKSIALFDILLYKIYEKYHQRFHPRIYKKLGIPVEENIWLKALNQLSNIGCLRANFELCCPEFNETIRSFSKFDDIPFGLDVECPNCGNEFNVDEQDVFITYTFNDIFKPRSCNGRDLPFFRDASTTIVEPISLDYYKMHPEIIYDMTIKGRKNSLNKIVNRLDVIEDTKRKGKLYELLGRKIFESFYLKTLKKGKCNRYSTGQIDIIFQVKRLEATIFQNFSDLLFVECKNWDDKVGLPEISAFSRKMRDNKLKIGIIFAKIGVTGDIESDFPKDGMGEIRRISDQGDGLILVYTHRDVLNILNGKNVYEQLVERYHFFKII